jgi:hypothetical protein
MAWVRVTLWPSTKWRGIWGPLVADPVRSDRLGHVANPRCCGRERVVTLDSPERQEFYGRTLKEALA